MLEPTTLSVELVGLCDFENAYKLLDDCAKNAIGPDVFPLYRSKLTSLATENKPSDSFACGATALAEVGFQVPKRVSKPLLIAKILTVRRNLKRMTNEQILSLPNTQDVRSAFIMDAMAKLVVPIYVLG